MATEGIELQTLHAIYREGNAIETVHRFCAACAPGVATVEGWPMTGRKKIPLGGRYSVEVVWGNHVVNRCDECSPEIAI